ncbi:MAG: IS3 family transposase [Acidimicrobiales bacterium]
MAGSRTDGEHRPTDGRFTYWVTKKRPPSARAVRDERLKVEIQRVYDENLFVHGADEIWTQHNNEGTRVARCTIERLMHSMGLSDARRGKTRTTTTDSDHGFDRPARPVVVKPNLASDTWTGGHGPDRQRRNRA